jgi:transposase
VRYELSDSEWAAIKPLLPNKSRGVRRVNDRRVLNGIFWVLRLGAPWRDLPVCYGPRTTCYNRFIRWRRAGVWGRIMDSLAAAHDAAIQMIDTSIVRRASTRRLHCQKQKPVDGSLTRRTDQQNPCSSGHERAACPSGTYCGRSSRQPARLESFISPDIGINGAG